MGNPLSGCSAANVSGIDFRALAGGSGRRVEELADPVLVDNIVVQQWGQANVSVEIGEPRSVREVPSAKEQALECRMAPFPKE